jgi:hypothetical protein
VLAVAACPVPAHRGQVCARLPVVKEQGMAWRIALLAAVAVVAPLFGGRVTEKGDAPRPGRVQPEMAGLRSSLDELQSIHHSVNKST